MNKTVLDLHFCVFIVFVHSVFTICCAVKVKLSIKKTKMKVSDVVC